MRKIKLADGTVYPVDLCGADDVTLAINITSDDNLLSLVQEFGNPENVSHIEHYYDGTETDHVHYDGYTKLTAAYYTRTGTAVSLMKAAHG